MLETGKSYRNTKHECDDIYILGKAESKKDSICYAVYFLTRDVLPTSTVGEIEIENAKNSDWSELKEV